MTPLQRFPRLYRWAKERFYSAAYGGSQSLLQRIGCKLYTHFHLSPAFRDYLKGLK